MAALPSSAVLIERIEGLLPDAALIESTEMIVDRLPRRKLRIVGGCSIPIRRRDPIRHRLFMGRGLDIRSS